MELKEKNSNSKNSNNFSEIFEFVPLSVAIVEEKGNILFANKVFKEYFGNNLPANIADLNLEDEKGTPLNFTGIFKYSTNLPYTAVVLRKNSKGEKYFKFHSNKIGKESGRFILVLEDITEEELKSKMFKCVLDNVDVVIFSMKPQGTEFDFISGAAKKILGFEIEDLINKKFTFLRSIRKEEYPKLRKFLKDVANGLPTVIEYGIVDKRGEFRFVRHSAVPIFREDKVVRIVGAIVDVTREAKLREELKYSEEKFRLLMETAQDLIFTLDARGNFLMVNKNGARALGFSQGEMIGKHLFDFIKEEEKPDLAVEIHNVLNSEKVVKFETTMIDSLNQGINFEFLAKSVRSKSGITGMVAIGRDITERLEKEKKLKELNDKLIESNRILSIERDRAKEKISMLEDLNKLKNDFISNVSHEFRTPLASIVGFAEAIASDSEMNRETILEFNSIIYEEGKRLAKLIDDLLDFSRLDTGEEPLEKSDFDIVPLLIETAKNFLSLAENKKILLETHIPEAEVIVKGDRERLGNAFGHILNNAIKFTGEGGRVSLILNDFLKEVEIIINDTGVGIPPEDIPQLFEKFSKVNRPGTQQPGAGMGLALVKKIIDLHKGWISIKSEINKGSTFIIRLPKKIN